MKLVKRSEPDRSIFIYDQTFEEFDRLHNPVSGSNPFIKYCEVIILPNGNIVSLIGSHQITLLNLVAKYMDVVDDDGNVVKTVEVKRDILSEYTETIRNKVDLIWEAVGIYDSIESIALYHLNLISIWYNLLEVRRWLSVTQEQKETIDKLYGNGYIKYSSQSMYWFGEVLRPSIDFLKSEGKVLLVNNADLYKHTTLPGYAVVFNPLEYACPEFKYKFAFELLLRGLLIKKKLVPHLLLFHMDYSIYNEDDVSIVDITMYITNREGSSAIRCGEKNIMKISTRFPGMMIDGLTDTDIINTMYKNSNVEYI